MAANRVASVAQRKAVNVLEFISLLTHFNLIFDGFVCVNLT